MLSSRDNDGNISCDKDNSINPLLRNAMDTRLLAEFKGCNHVITQGDVAVNPSTTCVSVKAYVQQPLIYYGMSVNQQVDNPTAMHIVSPSALPHFAVPPSQPYHIVCDQPSQLIPVVHNARQQVYFVNSSPSRFDAPINQLCPVQSMNVANSDSAVGGSYSSNQSLHLNIDPPQPVMILSSSGYPVYNNAPTSLCSCNQTIPFNQTTVSSMSADANSTCTPRAFYYSNQIQPGGYPQLRQSTEIDHVRKKKIEISVLKSSPQEVSSTETTVNATPIQTSKILYPLDCEDDNPVVSSTTTGGSNRLAPDNGIDIQCKTSRALETVNGFSNSSLFLIGGSHSKEHNDDHSISGSHGRLEQMEYWNLYDGHKTISSSPMFSESNSDVHTNCTQINSSNGNKMVFMKNGKRDVRSDSNHSDEQREKSDQRRKRNRESAQKCREKKLRRALKCALSTEVGLQEADGLLLKCNQIVKHLEQAHVDHVNESVLNVWTNFDQFLSHIREAIAAINKIVSDFKPKEAISRKNLRKEQFRDDEHLSLESNMPTDACKKTVYLDKLLVK